MCVTEWFQKWEAQGLIKSPSNPSGKIATGKKQVENRDLVEDVLELIRMREKSGAKTKFEWVKGHANDEGNVGADMLAVQGARMAEVLRRQ
jgi:ribonuclease HI